MASLIRLRRKRWGLRLVLEERYALDDNVGGKEREHVWDQAFQGARATRLQPQQVHAITEPPKIQHSQSPPGPQLEVASFSPGPRSIQHYRAHQKQRQALSLKILKLPGSVVPQKQAPQLVLGTNANHPCARAWIMYIFLLMRR